MKKLVLASMLAAIVAGYAPASAQQVKDLTGKDLTSDRLIDVLRPKEPMPEGLRSRGLKQKPPECTHFRKAASRGIRLRPKADIAAIKIEFENNSFDLTSQDKANLDQLGEALKSADLQPCCFEIQGYTDATGGAGYNKQLSEKRAKTVIDYLAAHESVEANRMMPKGLGKSHFIADNTTEEGRAKNRRVQIVNLGYGTASAE